MDSNERRAIRMNRRDRRAAKAMARNQSVDRVIAVHEAGHCVARVLVAASLGWDPDEVIECIDIHPAPIITGVVSLDGTRRLLSQAVSWGQFLSKPMHEFLAAKMPDTFAAALSGAPLGNGCDLVPIFGEMRAAGIDVDWWFRAKSIESIFGPMAEATLIGKPFEEAWNDYSSEDDKRGILYAGGLCGMTDDQIATATIENVYIAEECMTKPNVWRAISALADSLKYGRTSGRKAAAIITGVLAQSEPA
jgi:hypothetical protein